MIHSYQAHESRAARRIWLVLLTILCLIASLLLSVALPSPPAYGAPEDSKQPALSLTITPSSPIVAPNETLTIRATIANNSSDTLSLTSAELGTSKTTLTTHANLYEWLNSEPTSRPLAAPDDDIPVTLEPHSSTVLTFSVSPEERAWPTGRYSWGTHGIEVKIETSHTNASNQENNEEISTFTQRSVVVATSAEEVDRFPISIAAVCRTSQRDLKNIANPLEEALLDHSDHSETHTADSDDPKDSDNSNTSGTAKSSSTPKQPEKSTSQSTPQSSEKSSAQSSKQSSVQSSARTSTAALSAWDHSGINLLFDPISASDALKPAQASAYALPAYNADLSALAHAGDSTLITAITEQTSQALENQTNVNDERFTVFPNGIDAATLNYTAEHSLGTPIVMNSGLVSDERFYFPDASGTITDGTTQQSAIVANELVSMALQGTLLSPDFESSLPLSSEMASATALAVSAILYNQAPSFNRSLVALISPNCSETELSAEALALLSAPWLTPTALTQLPAPHEDVVWHTSENEVSTEEIQPSQIESVQTFIAKSSALAAALPSNPNFADSSYSVALRTLDQSWNSIPTDRNSLIESLDIENFLHTHIHLQAASRMNIIAEETNIPVRVRSDLTVPINLLPVLNIPDGRLVSSINNNVTIHSSGSTTLKIPIKVRGSGTMVVRAGLALASGENVTDTVALTMRLHASWETTSTAIAGVAIFLVLLIGILRSIRAGRRSRPISNEEFTEGLNSRTRHTSTTSLDSVTSPETPPRLTEKNNSSIKKVSKFS